MDKITQKLPIVIHFYLKFIWGSHYKTRIHQITTKTYTHTYNYYNNTIRITKYVYVPGDHKKGKWDFSLITILFLQKILSFFTWNILNIYLKSIFWIFKKSFILRPWWLFKFNGLFLKTLLSFFYTENYRFWKKRLKTVKFKLPSKTQNKRFFKNSKNNFYNRYPSSFMLKS